MKPTLEATIKAALLSPLNTIRESLSLPSRVSHNYMIVLAHPDDEILAAGLVNRLLKKSNPFLVTVTDGSGNTDKNRLNELRLAYQKLGYNGEVDCLLNESSIFETINSSPGKIAHWPSISKIISVAEQTIDELATRMRNQNTDIVVTNAFEGGHAMHDLTNLVVLYAANRVGAVVYEVSQYWLKTLEGSSQQEVYDALKLGTISYHADYTLGIPLNGGPGLDEPGLGIKSGILNVTTAELLLKHSLTKIHRSQRTSLEKSANNITHANFTTEVYRRVPTDREYTFLPSFATPLYDIRHMKIPHINFQTFAMIATKITK